MEALQLRLLKEGQELQVIDCESFGKPQLILGRGLDADIKMTDRAVGRHHAVIQLAETGVSLKKRTTFGKLELNGQEVTEANVKAGDVIGIAQYVVRVEAKISAEKPQSVNADVSHGSAVSGANGISESSSLKGPSVDAAPLLSVGEKTPAQGIQINSDSNQNNENLEIHDSSGEPANSEVAFVTDDKTAIVSLSQVVASLKVKKGEANIPVLQLEKSEVFIGRGSACDIVITDKQASRKHTSIRKVGAGYLVKDLGSANGTFVNGIKINEQELSGEDIIRIGDTEIEFNATNQEFVEQAQKGEFLTVETNEAVNDAESNSNVLNVSSPEVDQSLSSATSSELMQPPSAEAPVALNLDSVYGNPGNQSNINFGGTPELNTRKSLVERFKELPRRKKVLVLTVFLASVVLIWDLVDEQEREAKLNQKKKEESAMIAKDPSKAALLKMPKERREFIEQTYNLAFDHYKNKNYEQAIAEVTKIHDIAPNFSYKDSKDIERYAKQGLEQIRAQQEEQKRKEDEEKRKKKVEELMVGARELFKQNLLPELENLFAQILELDPDNPEVAKMKADLEELTQKRRLDEEQAQQREEIRRSMQVVLDEAKKLWDAGRYYESIDKLKDITKAGSDTQLIGKSKEMIIEIQSEIGKLRDPHIENAQRHFDSKEYDKSRSEWVEALKIDPKCQMCQEGIEKIRHAVHERAQRIYIEAILAESVSDLTGAKKKYIECFKASIPEDDYYGRCWRKYHRFTTLEGGESEGANSSSGESEPLRAPANAHKTIDPFTKEVLESL